MTADQLMMQSVAGLSVATPFETAAALGIGEMAGGQTVLTGAVIVIAALCAACAYLVAGVLWRAAVQQAEILDYPAPGPYLPHENILSFPTAVPTQELQSMSLEQAIEKNTVALNALNETIGKAKLTAHPDQPAKGATKAADATAAAKVPTPEAVAANAAAVAAAAAAPDYEKVVNPLILKCAKETTRPGTLAILNSFTAADGTLCTTGKHIKPEDYASLIAKLNAAIAAVSSAGDSLV